jgi:hypothetical protein
MSVVSEMYAEVCQEVSRPKSMQLTLDDMELRRAYRRKWSNVE